MPLARYEIRNEYSLANPDLYRAAAKDDPEGLLEGVAMAGLVGIVRQLGDLAEFAAEVFHDLHEEVYATAARGHELLIRVQQLEAELPAIENLMCADIDQAKFSYNPGVEWHASIRNDQNHFTQGDLPRFIRNAYEDCRGPPRLFLLDKFDVAGAGACLKRYTDPSFFKMEWASSELLKAEKEQQDKRARRIKKKGQRRRNGEIKDAGLLSQIHPRMHYAPLDVENLASTSSVHSNLGSEVRAQKASIGSIVGNSGTSDPSPASSSKLVPQYLGDNSKVNMDAAAQDVDLISDDAYSNCVKISSQEIEAEVMSGKTAQIADVAVQKDLNLGLKAGEDAVDDVASETDHYMDALTTMDSEVETDSESKIKVEAEIEFDKQLRENEASAPLNDSTSDELKASDELSLHTEEDDVFIHAGTENSEVSESLEPVIHIDSPPKGEISSIKAEESPSVHHSHVSLFQESNSASFNDNNISLSPSKPNGVSRSEVYVDSGRIDLVSETPKNTELNDHDNIQKENLPETFQRLPDPAIPLTKGAQTGFPEHFDSLSLNRRVQSSDIPFEGETGSSLQRNIFEGSESELTESPEEVSLQSRADFTIQPRSWANDSLDTDDDMDGMQISSGSPSSSSSTLSSPRPSMLATTVFHMHSKGEPESVLSSPESYGSSPKYPINMELHSHSPVSPLRTASESSSSSESNIQKMLPENSTASSPTQSPRISITEPRHSPPLPPLPPLEWRMMRRFNSTLSPSLNQMGSPPTLCGPPNSLVKPEKTFQASKTFAVPSANDWKDSPAFLAKTDSILQGSSSLSQTFENEKGTSIPAPEIPDNDSRFLASPSNVESNSPVSPLARLDESSLHSNPPRVASENERFLKSPPKAERFFLSPYMNECSIPVCPPERDDESEPSSIPPEVASNSEMQKSLTTLQRPDNAVKGSWPFVSAKFERQDSLIDAIATHDRNILKKVPEKSRSLRPVPSDDRQVLLEQIRTGSFSLRHTKIKKQEVPRPTTNINVAAILEKANAIRQAFAGSDDDDDDDDWSNT